MLFNWFLVGVVLEWMIFKSAVENGEGDLLCHIGAREVGSSLESRSSSSSSMKQTSMEQRSWNEQGNGAKEDIVISRIKEKE
ncbi:hypothetical protein PV325_007986 [Microctonus aethiopoides]|nr:hypothetical protein PV325_007986 [Microctonus aethiopoides]